MIFELREYQKQLKTDIRNLFQNGKRSVILCSPTGSGKTVTFADICRNAVDRGMKVLIAVDRKELLEQSVDKLKSYGLNPEIITGGKKWIDYKSKSYVATVQTLKKRHFPNIDLLVIDECHKQIFDPVVETYKQKNVFVIGATATPIRKGKNQRQFGAIYDEIVQSVEIADLISDGYLSPCRSFGSVVELENVRTQNGDYKSDDLFNIYNKPYLYDGLIKHWLNVAKTRKTIVFNINVKHSKLTNEVFRNAGINSAHVDGTTPKKERERILRDFKFGKIQVLNNVDILTTGFDEPSIGCVVVNRRTKSVPLWLQMVGRGSRIYPGKNDFVLLDMGGNIIENGFWERSRSFSLWHKVHGGGIAPEKQCPDPLVEWNDDGTFVEIEFKDLTLKQKEKHGCGRFVPAGAVQCECGYIFPKKKREMLETEMSELISNGDDIVVIPDHLKKPYNEMNFDELIQIQKIKGFKKHWILHQIKPTDDNLERVRVLLGYQKKWIYFAKKNIYKIK